MKKARESDGRQLSQSNRGRVVRIFSKKLRLTESHRFRNIKMSLLHSYLTALFVTIAVELVVAFLFGFRKKTEIIVIIFINILTNPALNYALGVISQFSFFRSNVRLGPPILLLAEMVVVLIEWGLLVLALQEKPKKMLVLSLAMNFCSYVAGMAIFWFTAWQRM